MCEINWSLGCVCECVVSLSWSYYKYMCLHMGYCHEYCWMEQENRRCRKRLKREIMNYSHDAFVITDTPKNVRLSACVFLPPQLILIWIRVFTFKWIVYCLHDDFDAFSFFPFLIIIYGFWFCGCCVICPCCLCVRRSMWMSIEWGELVKYPYSIQFNLWWWQIVSTQWRRLVINPRQISISKFDKLQKSAYQSLKVSAYFMVTYNNYTVVNFYWCRRCTRTSTMK